MGRQSSCGSNWPSQLLVLAAASPCHTPCAPVLTASRAQGRPLCFAYGLTSASVPFLPGEILPIFLFTKKVSYALDEGFKEHARPHKQSASNSGTAGPSIRRPCFWDCAVLLSPFISQGVLGRVSHLYHQSCLVPSVAKAARRSFTCLRRDVCEQSPGGGFLAVPTPGLLRVMLYVVGTRAGVGGCLPLRSGSGCPRTA